MQKKWPTHKRLGMTIFYDQDCSFCEKSASILKMFFLIPETKVLPAQSDEVANKEMLEKNSWVVRDYEGKDHFKFDGVIKVAQLSPLLRPFAFILKTKPVRSIGTILYDVVAVNRDRTCAVEKRKP